MNNNAIKLRIVFIGCVKSTAYFLREMIAENQTPVGVVTKSASRFNSDFEDLTPICKEHNIPFHYVDNISDEASLAFVKSCNPDIIYCFGWSQLLKSELLSIPSKGCVGFHPAALPYNKGRHPIIWALALGLKETASSFFMMDEKADNGAIVSQEKIAIADDDTALTLYDKILEIAGKQVVAFTKDFENGSVRLVPQSDKTGNSWRKRSAKDGLIDWRMSCEAIYNLVRALTRPYPGAQFAVNGVCKTVWKAEIVKDSDSKLQNIESGKVLKVVSHTDFYVKAYDGTIHITDCEDVDLKEGDYL